MAKKTPAKKTAPTKKSAAPSKKGVAKSPAAKKAPASKKKAPPKAASAKKGTVKKTPAKKAAPKNTASTEKKVSSKKTPKTAAAAVSVAVGAAKKAPAKKNAVKKAAAKVLPVMSVQDALANGFLAPATPPKTPYKAAFLKKQQQKLRDLRDDLVDTMAGVTRDTLRSDNGGNDASGSGMHQADAGSDAYDRDFALQLLASEQDSLHEIESALKRIDQGYYGVCEMTGNKIGQLRLEAMPFCRYTVEYQAQLERDQALVGKLHTRPLEPTFGQDFTEKLKSSLE